MKIRRILWALTSIVALSAVLASCVPIQPPQEPAPAAGPVATQGAVEEWIAAEGALVAVRVDAAPIVDGIEDDSVWNNAPAITVDVKKGANMGETTVSLQAAYDNDNLYMLMKWADPTESFLRSPWVKQEDGAWAKLKDPDDKGGDNNVYYEDKLAMIWNINNSIPRFKGMGCFTACHDDGPDAEVKPYGNKYTREGMGDIWHWKSVRNIGQMDDQYLDSTQYSPDTPEAGRHSDPKESGGYVDNQTEDKTMPMWMGPEGYPRDGSPGYILDEEKQPFDDSLFARGDMIPGIVKSPIVGDRGNIAAGWHWADGTWTLEVSRPLVTGSEFDVQFDDLTQPYYFGVAVFDNAQVRHAYHTSSRGLVFQP